MTTTTLTRSDLTAEVTDLLRRAGAVYAGSPDVVTRLEMAADRLHGPVRVAIAGKVKAGKSTLLNALVGETVAPTDAGECTRIVTWYRDAPMPRILLQPTAGPAREMPIRRSGGRLDLDLDGYSADEIARIVVDWPYADLAYTTLIDTPGIASVRADVSDRAEDFLLDGGASSPGVDPGSADAVVYLMRHVHADDIGFLQTFHATSGSGASPVNTIAVLSRADEIGAGRVDALASANQIARRLRSDETVRALCQTVLPVAGLLAETGRTLRQDEFAALEQLANGDRALVDSMLLSADRFVGPFPPDVTSVPSPAVRSELLARFGLFGVRTALPLIRQGCIDAPSLAAELVRRSGLQELVRTLGALFTERAGLLKARSVLALVEQIARDVPADGSEALLGEVERIASGAHEFAEFALLGRLRGGGVPLDPDATTEAERILGGLGHGAADRLGLEPEATPAELRAAALDALTRWRRRADNPVSIRAVADAARIVARSCEGLLATLPDT
ncbi:MAG: dynamin family protein [Sporichthyaceae bacterium]